jgi:O-antigen/teichoic acid export membrane protein
MPALKPPAASLKRSFVWMFAGNLIFTATQWGMLAVLTKLTTDAVSGQYGLGLSLSTPVFMFAGLDLRLLLVTDSNRRYRFSDYLTLRLLCGGLGLVVVFGLGLAWDFGATTLAVIMAVAFGKLVELISDMYYGQIQTHDRLDAVSQSMIFHGVASCAGFVACLALTGNIFGACVAYALSRAAVLMFYDLPVSKNLVDDSESENGDELKATRLWALAKTGAPLSVKTLLVALNTHVARYFVVAEVGLAGLGVFFPIAQLGFAGLTFSRSLNQSVAGRVGELVQTGRLPEFRTLLRKMLGLYAVIGVVCVSVSMIAGETILTLAFDSGYAQHSFILTLIMVAMGLQFMTGILDLGMIALRRRILPAWLSALSLAILTLCCWKWVPEYGFTGAAAAMIVSRGPRPLVLAWVVFQAEGPLEESAMHEPSAPIELEMALPAEGTRDAE